MIGGNITAQLQVSTSVKNEIGERVKAWHTVTELRGWLDYSSGDSRRTSFDAKIQETTHLFLCDYKPIPDTFTIEGKTVKVNAEITRMVANSKHYDVLVIDNPMELNKQLEIYLKYTGGQ